MLVIHDFVLVLFLWFIILFPQINKVTVVNAGLDKQSFLLQFWPITKGEVEGSLLELSESSFGYNILY